MQDINKMILETVEIFKKYESTGTKKWTAEIAARDLSYQVGSLNKIIMQMNQERYAENKTVEELKHNLADELADIMAEVLFISHTMNIDINEAWKDMLNSDNKKIENRNKDA